MNVPMSWLKQYVDIDVDMKTFEDRMTMSGSKVEAVEETGKEITKVVSGKIIDVQPHPNADKLRIMQVDIKGERTLQIVTAATNVQCGDIVPVSLDGATLADGLKIKSGKLRGEVSEGMFCSVEELGFDEKDIEDAPHNGVYIFPADMPLGVDVKPYFGLGEQVVEYEITSNRPDCFSILGIAREAAATFNKPFKFPEIKVEEIDGDINEFASIQIENEELCPRYAARLIKNVKVGPSPKWLKDRLFSAGLRPINNIVDITNYMLLEFGQPMHAFDYDKLAGHQIIVRNAKEGEKLITLFEEEKTLDSSMLVIADAEKAVAIAGVMGGNNSKVTEETKTILFECANFSGYSIRQTSKKLGLRSDSSIKYTKGLDPNNITLALERAAQLINLTGAGEVVKGTIDVYPRKREEWTIPYDVQWINHFLGTSLSEDEMLELFKRVEFIPHKESQTVTIPTFRPDVTMMADLAEEVARLYGYDRIEPTLERGRPTRGRKKFDQLVCDAIRQFMSMYGVHGALTYTFESPKVFDKLNIAADSALRNPLVITNPLGEDFSIMRTTTLNGILSSLATNYNRRVAEAALYEIGKVYLKQEGKELPAEIKKLTIGLYGKNADFFSLKGMIEALLDHLHIETWEVERQTELDYMHPGRCANLLIDGKEAGFFGEVHPIVTKNYDIGTKVYMAEIDLEALLRGIHRDITFKALPKYPATARDIAMLVGENVLVGELEKIIKVRGGKLLEKLELFDVYQGKQIEAGYKSVAYKLTFRADDHTLTDEEIQKVMKKILSGLEMNCGAKLRDQ
ncbi:phenylalanine--tRNA ligase subunit beta [Sporanaerobium hydrogeniformans]|uniref:Phenylalanine--tRNA ligase subunit beta n=1 Tax=Sporanaerobium hydrogeniformans TaxID=3072179 RepID=A0AC61DFL5_9FIRM|nr:phenylalanine--tRNA ligase subunit beta [Sporanaerobium hydrogeniformans]PHV71603.1 phenylalanine--tRNA ligase subunit beta [Sporanaerobium hydrogeniformans]